MNHKHLNPLIALSAVVVTVISPISNLAAPVNRTATFPPPNSKFPPGVKDPLAPLVSQPRPKQNLIPSTRPQLNPNARLGKDAPIWSRVLSTPGRDGFNDVATDATGNVYATGYTEGKLGFQHYGKYDAGLVKYSPEGKLLWRTQLGTTEDDFATGVATDGVGNVYITGYTEGKFGARHYGKSDAWVAKYSTAGALLWIQQIGTTSAEYAIAVMTDKTGNVYLLGGEKPTSSSPDTAQTLLAKYSTTGTLVWIKGVRQGFTNNPRGMAIDGAGNVYVAVNVVNSCGATFPRGITACLLKYSPAGTYLWKQSSQRGEYSFFWDVVADTTGNVYVIHTFVEEGGATGPRIYDDLRKYSAAGKLLWQKPEESFSYSDNATLAIDRAGNVYTQADFITQQDNRAFIIQKYNPAGNLLSIIALPEKPQRFPRGMTVDKFGNVYIAGLAGTEPNPNAILEKYRI